jgi:hypothetical protein
MAERAFERVIGEFGDLPGHFDTGRARADHRERHQLLASRRVARPFGLLERADNTGPQLECVVDRLHARRVLGEVVVAEVRLAGACGHDQAVVRGDVGVAKQLRRHRLLRQVDVGDLAQQYLRVALFAQDHASRRGDLTRRDDAGGHLVQQRLKQVMSGLGDHLHVDIGPLQGLGGGETTEPRPDDDDLVPIRCSGSGMAHLGLLGGRHVQIPTFTLVARLPEAEFLCCGISHVRRWIKPPASV